MANDSYLQIDPNEASSDKWLLTMPGNLQLMSAKATNFDLPGFNAEGTVGPKGGFDTLLPIPGDTITFDPMVFTYLVDEGYENYIQVASKLVDNVRKEPSELFFDCSIIPLNNRGNDQKLEFRYQDCRVTGISTVAYDNTAGIRALTCTVTIQFGNFQIYKNGIIRLSTNKSDMIQ